MSDIDLLMTKYKKLISTNDITEANHFMASGWDLLKILTTVEQGKDEQALYILGSTLPEAKK